MTIEEKAKAYDDAKARMSKAYNSNRCTIGFMNEIFPELKESEGERIRKALINFFDNANKCGENPMYEYGIYSEEILAWLEKQGEQEKEIRGKEEKISPKQAQETAIGKLNDANVRKEFKWDSENKIMTIYGVTYEEIKALDDFIYCLRSGLNLKADADMLIRLAQKPTDWSEEDETIINNLVWAIANDKIRPQDRDDYCDWLKTLKQRIGE